MSYEILVPKGMEKGPYELNRLYAERILEYNIVTLNLPPGELVSEYELAKALDISRTPVHEALIELSKKFLISIIPQVGSKVAFIDTKKVEAVCFVRISIEKAMLPRAFERISPAGITNLHTLLRLQKDAASRSDYHQFLEHDNAFHRALFAIADLEYAGSLLEDMMPTFNRVRMLIYKNLDLPRIIREHSMLVDSLEQKMLEQAMVVLDKHLSHDVLHDVNLLREKFPDYFLPSDNLYI